MRLSPPILALLLATGFAFADEKKGPADPALETASGVVEKADKDALVIKPRGPDGKFQKALTLTLTGTSKVTVLTPQKRGDKVVMTQRETEAKDLVPGQSIAVIYAEVGKDGSLLLSAVAHPVPAK